MHERRCMAHLAAASPRLARRRGLRRCPRRRPSLHAPCACMRGGHLLARQLPCGNVRPGYGAARERRGCCSAVSAACAASSGRRTARQRSISCSAGGRHRTRSAAWRDRPDGRRRARRSASTPAPVPAARPQPQLAHTLLPAPAMGHACVSHVAPHTLLSSSPPPASATPSPVVRPPRPAPPLRAPFLAAPRASSSPLAARSAAAHASLGRAEPLRLHLLALL
ncbi:hypothetical protein FA09DRAFT_77732 [Tilletiopsis washingtonensis]|uniref:Uncharacterized protein n=1 Tax=Tilletiopsis washingtonensis TaxID=58919 RepID=A0A316Z5L0_9BASI|nr:hypothetical protein FA09DRAFT_77732 [Tilletiopsis washingtonensis]PWN96586.1 hypothetical protein FA09DRAFT_77732 [Tilletiopsis washingtonensis]